MIHEIKNFFKRKKNHCDGILQLCRVKKQPYKSTFNVNDPPVYGNETEIVEKTQERLDKLTPGYITIKLIKPSLIREHKLGTQRIINTGNRYTYAKIDFGIKADKTYRVVWYGWTL